MPNPVEELRASVVHAVERALERLVPAGAGIVGAVSGGADSVALAWALARVGARWPLVAVAFVDHGLRDVAAERAAARAIAAEVDARFVERRVDVVGKNLQAAARQARYRALIEVAREHGPEVLVATGHTLSDQAETVLGRLLRGSGLPGLAGLAPRRGRLVRPFLSVSRRHTRALGLPFADDPSNATPRFQRNRLRALLERFGDEQPAIEAALAGLAEVARATTRLLDGVALAAADTSLIGQDPETTETLLVHLARAHGARGLERRASRAWGEALIAGGLSAVSLGESLRGLAREGRAAIVGDDDPRRAVVAWRPGTYRASAMTLELTETRDRPLVSPPEGEAWARPADVAWPLKLRPARANERGAFGDEVDLATGATLGGWRLEDASGRTLVPDAGAVSPSAAVAAGRAVAARSSDETHWIRIVLKPLSAAAR